MAGGSAIPDPGRGQCGKRPVPDRALSLAALLSCGIALGAASASGQGIEGGAGLGRLVVPLPDDAWTTLDASEETDPDRGRRPPGSVMMPASDHLAINSGRLSEVALAGPLCPDCAGQPAGRLLAPPAGRHRGWGHPLTCESWRFRPFSGGWFVGVLGGGSLIDDWVAGQDGFFGGYRLAWDYDHYWGCEMRFSFGNVALDDSQRARQAQEAADDDLGIPADDPFRDRFQRRRDATVGFWDIDLLYYPWGDAAWRPYVMLGLGTARTKFIDRLSTRYRETVFAMPLALGLKYRLNSCTAVRLELADNIAFGDELNTVHYGSLTAGMEIRFGGSRVAYWPWNPSRHYW